MWAAVVNRKRREVVTGVINILVFLLLSPPMLPKRHYFLVRMLRFCHHFLLAVAMLCLLTTCLIECVHLSFTGLQGALDAL